MDHGLARLMGLDELSFLSQKELYPLPVFYRMAIRKRWGDEGYVSSSRNSGNVRRRFSFGKKRMFVRSICNIDIIASIARLHDVGKGSLFVASHVKRLFWGGNNFSFFSSDILHDVSFS